MTNEQAKLIAAIATNYSLIYTVLITCTIISEGRNLGLQEVIPLLLSLVSFNAGIVVVVIGGGVTIMIIIEPKMLLLLIKRLLMIAYFDWLTLLLLLALELSADSK